MPGAGGGRKLRPWLVEQVESGRFPGLVWDDPQRSALRIPWQHAGKGGARGGAGTALCQAWAEFKGRVQPGSRPDPAGWKTRLRCALNKSPEFQEVPERGRNEGPHPYKVYRLLPPPQQQQGHQSQKRGGPRPAPEAELIQEPRPLVMSPPPEDTDGDVTAVGGASLPHAAPLPEAPPPTRMGVVLDSPQPLPPATGDAALVLRVWLGGAVTWQGRFPPGEYLIASSPPGHAPSLGLLPRLLLWPRPTTSPCSALGAGLMVASTNRGLFLRWRGRGRAEGAGPGGEEEAGHGLGCRAPHGGTVGTGGRLPQGGEPVLAFDAGRFRQEVGQHRAGLGPRPEHRVMLAVGQELGPSDGPHNRDLILQLEQAFAQQLQDGNLGTPCPLLP
ncbi:interferon regulatory factor 9-like [Calypte anna]|uniref:interferon regulatory factor 9-like n=1 Tax=Calypte anna TaxID=9244 RepID=UPI0011C4517F|nr:interferon regulatory factor 9-like [Calypte anna]